MKNRIVKLLMRVEECYGTNLEIRVGKQVVKYLDIDGEINRIEFLNNDDFIMLNGEETSFNEFVNILTDQDPYCLL